MVRDSRKAVGGEEVEWGADIIEAEIRGADSRDDPGDC
jgi:hypothetical protein